MKSYHTDCHFKHVAKLVNLLAVALPVEISHRWHHSHACDGGQAALSETHTPLGTLRIHCCLFMFILQAVDFALPTTPTNTAHYAIVPPPTPTLSPKSGLSSPISGAMAMGPDPSSRPPHMRSPKFGPASGGGGGGALGSKVAASKLPQDSSDTAADGSAGETSAEVWPRRNSGRAQSVVMRSSAGQEWENSR